MCLLNARIVDDMVTCEATVVVRSKRLGAASNVRGYKSNVGVLETTERAKSSRVRGGKQCESNWT